MRCVKGSYLLKKVFQFNFSLKEQAKNQRLISPTDRGMSRMKKILVLLSNFKKAKTRNVKFELNFQLSRKFVIQIRNQNYIYEITNNLVNVLRLDVDGLAVVNNPIPFILPSESLQNALLRLIRLSVINVNLPKRKIQACIESNLIDNDQEFSSDVSCKKLNSITLAILECLGISTVIIALQTSDKCFPELEKFSGNLIFFEAFKPLSEIDSESELLKVRDLK